jgi:hypothetical protein
MSTQRVPAWKRLGLKLKGAASEQENSAPAAPATAEIKKQSEDSATPGHNGLTRTSVARGIDEPAASKRKHEAALAQSNGSKRLRLDDSTTTSTEGATKNKPADQIIQEAKAAHSKKKKKEKKAKRKAAERAKKAVPEKMQNFEKPLAYLRQWATDRGAWSFRKKDQAALIKYVFDGQTLPSSDIDIFYEYIRELEGGSRTRLRENAENIRNKDTADGNKGFSGALEDRKKKQAAYEEVLESYMDSSRATTDGAGKQSMEKFDEVTFAAKTEDEHIRARLIRRMRAERILLELSVTNKTISTAKTAEPRTTVTSKPPPNGEAKKPDQTRRSRPRKRRVELSDSSSSSESESESSSSDSSDDENREE